MQTHQSSDDLVPPEHPDYLLPDQIRKRIDARERRQKEKGKQRQTSSLAQPKARPETVTEFEKVLASDKARTAVQQAIPVARTSSLETTPRDLTEALDESLKKLGLEYLDCRFLLMLPNARSISD